MKPLQGESLNKLLKAVAEYDIASSLYWNADLEFCIICSDLFAWGRTDCEAIESENDIDLLIKSCEDCGLNGPELYCARKRKRRPHGAYYQYFDASVLPLFDACGPYREVGLGNPYASGKDE